MAIATGWADIGNNLVKNSQTGQVVDQNHPIYQQAVQAGSPSGPAPAAPTASVPAPVSKTAQDVGNATGTVGQQTPQGGQTSVGQSFFQGLINRLNPQAVSASNPAIQPAIQANQLAEQRGFERNRNLLAERAAANGTNNSGGFETSLLGLAQDRAGREGEFEGSAVRDLADRQSREALASMGMAGNLLGGNANRQQQTDLANLDAELRRQGLNQQGELGRGDLDLRRRLGEGQLNLGLLGALFQNDQFGRSLGQNAAQFGAGLDQSGLLGLLGML